jgi:hypothetical protein
MAELFVNTVRLGNITNISIYSWHDWYSIEYAKLDTLLYLCTR